MGYELLEHTADLGLHVWSEGIEELFGEAGRALIAVMGRVGPGPSLHAEVALEAPDLEALLVDWLSELLYVFEGKGMVPVELDVQVSEGRDGQPWRLTGTVRGPDAESFEQEGPAVKAVTYHMLRVEASDAGYDARVYLDI